MNGNSNACPDWKFRTGQDPMAPHPCRSDRWARRAQVMWGVIGILNCRDDDCSRETIGAWRYGATASSGGELRAFTGKTESRGFPAGTNRNQGLCGAGRDRRAALEHAALASARADGGGSGARLGGVL